MKPTEQHEQSFHADVSADLPGPLPNPPINTPLQLLPGARGVTAPTPPGSTAHWPALDGVRGLAILAVMLMHMAVLRPVRPPSAWAPVVPESHLRHAGLDSYVLQFADAGWMGVDLFFVLSGFLITGILLETKSAPYYFRNFYARRILRIFPLYYALVAVAFWVVPRVGALHANTGDGGGAQAWYWLYISNIHFALVGGYPNPLLGTTWSLAVEEHFYMVWPLAVWWLGRRALGRVCVGIIATALVSRLVLNYTSAASPVALYVLTFTRMDSLAIGALLAVIMRSPAGLASLGRAGRWLFWPLLGLALALASLEGFDSGGVAVRTWGYTLCGLTAAALISWAMVAPAGSWSRRVLTRPFLLSFGKYSYALYLLHSPIRTLIRDHVYKPEHFLTIGGSMLPGQAIFYAIALGASWLAAYASYHLFEKHFLKLKRYFGRGAGGAVRGAAARAAATPAGPPAAPAPAAH